MILPSHRGAPGLRVRSRLHERERRLLFTQRHLPLLPYHFPSLPIPPSPITTPSPHLSSTSQPSVPLVQSRSKSAVSLMHTHLCFGHFPQLSVNSHLHEYLQMGSLARTWQCTVPLLFGLNLTNLLFSVLICDWQKISDIIPSFNTWIPTMLYHYYCKCLDTIMLSWVGNSVWKKDYYVKASIQPRAIQNL